jgi:hypothetical protein
MHKGAKKKSDDAYGTYRQVLGMPNAKAKEIDGMRKHVINLARAICEHVWGKKRY